MVLLNCPEILLNKAWKFNATFNKFSKAVDNTNLDQNAFNKI